MPRDGPGPGGVRRSRRLRAAAATPDPDWRDWARGLPDEVLARIFCAFASDELRMLCRHHARGGWPGHDCQC